MDNLPCTVLVASCDKYADILEPFSILWKKYWPDCPFQTVLVTEREPAKVKDLCFQRVIAMGEGGCWCGRLVGALRQIDTPYILMLCDDYFLRSPVPTSQILRRLEQMRQFQALNLRMIPNPQPTKCFREDLQLMEYEKDTAYCIATQAGFWDRSFLMALASRADSIWEFERFGSFACGDETRPLLCTKRREFPFVDAIHKGNWEPFGVSLCQENGIDIDFSKRGLPSKFRRMIERGKGLILNLNPTLVVKIQNILNIGKKESKKSR